MPTVLLDRDPIEADSTYRFGNSPFTAKWIGPPEIPADFSFFALRRQVDGAGGPLRIHVSADQRYLLFLNGRHIGRGPERGDLRHWMYETHDLDLPAGKNTIVAIVWWLSQTGATPPPWAQITQRPGFWLQAKGNGAAEWNSGVAGWQIKSIAGLAIDAEQMVHFPASIVGPRTVKDARVYPWGVEDGASDDWTAATIIQDATCSQIVRESLPYWLLRPAMLPSMRDEPLDGWSVRHVDSPPASDTINFVVIESSPSSLAGVDGVRGSAVPGRDVWTAGGAGISRGRNPLPPPPPARGGGEEIPARTRRRFIIDLQRYACAYSRLIVSGGRDATIRLRWAESLYKNVNKPITHAYDLRDKGNRGEIEGRLFVGTGDRYIADGGALRVFEPLWWNAGRYIELVIETAGDALTINLLELRSTGYPYEFQSTFAASDERLAEVETLALHTLKMCSHETSMDCPYYEQLNYAGDTRLQSLVALATSRDDLLVRKSLRLFDWSRTGDNWSSSRWPTSVIQTIPPFAMWWACMAYDFALWRGDLPFVRTLMPGVRAILERWREQIGADGLIRQPEGWNFVDWVKGWDRGMANGAIGSPCGILQWQLVYTLMKTAELEDMLGEPLLAQRNRQTAAALAASAERAFYDQRRQLLASDLAHAHFSEHAQVLALLSGQLSENLREAIIASIAGDAAIDRATLYFRHYTFEALTEIGRTDVMLKRMDTWFEHRGLGLSTGLEQPEPSRSDCHAWSAHPAYHFYASILGIRPAAAGFERVRITPRLGSLAWAKGEMVHPRGFVRADFRQQGGRVTGSVELPAGVTGELVLPGGSRPITPGVMNF